MIQGNALHSIHCNNDGSVQGAPGLETVEKIEVEKTLERSSEKFSARNAQFLQSVITANPTKTLGELSGVGG